MHPWDELCLHIQATHEGPVKKRLRHSQILHSSLVKKEIWKTKVEYRGIHSNKVSRKQRKSNPPRALVSLTEGTTTVLKNDVIYRDVSVVGGVAEPVARGGLKSNLIAGKEK